MRRVGRIWLAALACNALACSGGAVDSAPDGATEADGGAAPAIDAAIDAAISAAVDAAISAADATADDQCSDDPNKDAPGQCGCGVPDTDSDRDGTADCQDGCPDDPDKTEPGECDCGIPEGTCDGGSEFGCGEKYETRYDGDIIVADDNEDAIFILEGEPRRRWDLATDTRWRFDVGDARDADGQELGSDFTSIFSQNKNDAKPVWYRDAMHILVVTNAGDGVALIRLSDQRVVYWKDLGSGGVHSGAVLPDGNIILADSQKKKDGDTHGAVIVLSTTTGTEHHCWHAGAHGSVWDHERQRVWVWGGSRMAAYEYNGNRDSPRLLCDDVQKWTGVGTGGGHDLTPKLDDSRKLLFTCNTGIYWFDTTVGRERWRAVDDSLGRGLKAVSYNPTTEEYIYVKAESDSRSDDVLSLSTPSRNLSDGKWYKARWFLPNCFGWPP